MKNQYADSSLTQQASNRLFAEKIAHYAQRKPKHFLQLDAVFAPEDSEGQIQIDLEGDSLDARGTVELMHGSNVRVLIPQETHPKVAIRQLKKLAKLLKAKPELMDFAKPDKKDTQVFEEDEDGFLF